VLQKEDGSNKYKNITNSVKTIGRMNNVGTNKQKK